jgi:tRNA G46 methylase TrmB
MYHLHQIYKTKLKPNGKFLMFDDVVNYINEQEPILLVSSTFSTFSTFKKGGAKREAASNSTVSNATVSEEPSTEDAV